MTSDDEIPIFLYALKSSMLDYDSRLIIIDGVVGATCSTMQMQMLASAMTRCLELY